MTRISLVTTAIAALSLVAGLPAAAQDGGKSGRIDVTPYIEAAQVLNAELSPGNDTVTYTRLAAGVDATLLGRKSQGVVSLRYEHRVGWGDAEDGDVISGVARVSAALAQGLSIEAGGVAARTRVDNSGAAVLSPFTDDDAVTDVYSLFAGPSLHTMAGDIEIEADYRIGYSRVDNNDAIVSVPGEEPIDLFDESTVHSANVRAGISPHAVLPVGLGVGAGWYREDISNLDQRIDDRHVRADVTVPLSPNIALVGGVGYEDVEISSRDVLRDAFGDPVIGPGGSFVTDESGPRVLAYDVDGFIWDVGVMWRPSVRTALEAHVGRRYGSTSFWGTFSWQATHRSSINIGVYDDVAGFGGQINRALVSLPTEFTASRNAITGDLSSCMSSLEGGSCLGGAFGSIRSAAFRARGVAATYALELGRINAGIGAGYDRRKFIAAEDTILASANGLTDENVWLAAYLNAQLSPRSRIDTNFRANWFDSELDLSGSTSAYGATAAYSRLLTQRLSATAAVGIDGLSRKELEDIWVASALLGMRYNF